MTPATTATRPRGRDDLVAAVYVGSGATDGVGMTEGWRDRLGGSSSGAR
ncbi:hypothetical protein M6B38_162585 [Iris pallida]|uniref:Uncharacterized protein n=1 Tax=Iris pallida TaxID=29817 RepID=A0AAX6F037_IRIPA|nr:hypothetical protein M6B38_162585 [Iris pallida]